MRGRMRQPRRTAADIGRVGTLARLELGRRIGTDNVDSCQPLWALDRLEAFGLARAAANADGPIEGGRQ